jgi:hypothetical protein
MWVNAAALLPSTTPLSPKVIDGPALENKQKEEIGGHSPRNTHNGVKDEPLCFRDRDPQEEEANAHLDGDIGQNVNWLARPPPLRAVLVMFMSS